MVGIGGAVFLACDNRYVGAMLFTVALLAICSLGMSLYTGKVGYLVDSHGRSDVLGVGSALLGNLAGTLVCALLVCAGRPEAAQTARSLCEGKLARGLLAALPSGVLCGVLMYVAVQVFRVRNTYLGMIFCIPVFILSGFEHSIADLFYFWLASFAGLRGWACVGFLLLVILGNGIGGCLLPALNKLSGGEKK